MCLGRPFVGRCLRRTIAKPRGPHAGRAMPSLNGSACQRRNSPADDKRHQNDRSQRGDRFSDFCRHGPPHRFDYAKHAKRFQRCSINGVIDRLSRHRSERRGEQFGPAYRLKEMSEPLPLLRRGRTSWLLFSRAMHDRRGRCGGCGGSSQQVDPFRIAGEVWKYLHSLHCDQLSFLDFCMLL
jgi:hypothetical protein